MYIEEEPELENFDPFDIRDAFFEFTCSIMKDYKKFTIPPN